MLELKHAYGLGIEPFVVGNSTKLQEHTTVSEQVSRFKFAWGYLEERVEEGGRTWMLFAADPSEEGPGVESAKVIWEKCNRWMPNAVASLPTRNTSSGEFARCFVDGESYSPALRLELAVEVLSRFEDLVRSHLDKSAIATQSLMQQLSAK